MSNGLFNLESPFLSTCSLDALMFKNFFLMNFDLFYCTFLIFLNCKFSFYVSSESFDSDGQLLQDLILRPAEKGTNKLGKNHKKEPFIAV